MREEGVGGTKELLLGFCTMVKSEVTFTGIVPCVHYDQPPCQEGSGGCPERQEEGCSCQNIPRNFLQTRENEVTDEERQKGTHQGRGHDHHAGHHPLHVRRVYLEVITNLEQKVSMEQKMDDTDEGSANVREGTHQEERPNTDSSRHRGELPVEKLEQSGQVHRLTGHPGEIVEAPELSELPAPGKIEMRSIKEIEMRSIKEERHEVIHQCEGLVHPTAHHPLQP